jgi:hypothetical protein
VGFIAASIRSFLRAKDLWKGWHSQFLDIMASANFLDKFLVPIMLRCAEKVYCWSKCSLEWAGERNVSSGLHT